MSRNRFLLGFFTGLVTPVFGMICWFVLYFERKGLTWDQFIGAFSSKGLLRTRIIVLGLLFLFPLFMYFYNRQRMDEMRGVVMALFVYAIVVLSLMLL